MADEIEKRRWEVRRLMQHGGWALILRTDDEYKAREVGARFQDMVRSKGVAVDVVAVRS